MEIVQKYIALKPPITMPSFPQAAMATLSALHQPKEKIYESYLRLQNSTLDCGTSMLCSIVCGSLLQGYYKIYALQKAVTRSQIAIRRKKSTGVVGREEQILAKC